MQEHEPPSGQTTDQPAPSICQGPLMPIGGAEEKDGNAEDESILSRFVELAGGKKARIAIIPTASEAVDEAGRRYVDVFQELGVKGADWLRVDEREDANGDEAVRFIEGATGIFITGGDQKKLVALLSGTRVMECIRECNANGVVVAGTSAGASIIPTHMMSGGTGVGGNSNDAAARKGMVEFVAGFGLLQDVIVDQHFSQRGRMGRLLTAFAASPGLVGIGLDEDTAVLIDCEGMLEVLGSGMVTIVDGRDTVSDYFEREAGEVLTITKSSLHVLAPGRHFDLNVRQAVELSDPA